MAARLLLLLALALLRSAGAGGTDGDEPVSQTPIVGRGFGAADSVAPGSAQEVWDGSKFVPASEAPKIESPQLNVNGQPLLLPPHPPQRPALRR